MKSIFIFIILFVYSVFFITTCFSQISISRTKTNVSCYNGNDGSIDITVTGGITPYSYLWSNNATTQDINSLGAGNYTVTVTDFNNNTAYDTISVTQPLAPLAITQISITNVSCKYGSNGAIYPNITGGTAPYTYAWSTSETTQSITALDSGIYSVVVTDLLGCTTYDTFVITEPSAFLTVNTVSTSNIICFGGTGIVDIAVNGGTSPYSYNWSNGDITEDIFPVAAGIYSVIVTDTFGCVEYDTFTLTQPQAVLNIIIDSTQNINCYGGTNGSINISVSSGTLPYSYSWSNSDTTQDISSLAAGTYSVAVTDSSGYCSVYDSITITQPTTALISNISINNVSCHGGNNGSISISVTGCNPPYSFSWSNNAKYYLFNSRYLCGLCYGFQ